MNALFAFFAISLFLLSPLLSETIAAIHRAVAARLERHAGGLSARGADRVEHLLAPAHPAAAASAAASAAGGFLGGATRRAPLGLVREAELGKPLLLAGGERKGRPTIHTRQLLVAVHALNPKKPCRRTPANRCVITIEIDPARKQNRISLLAPYTPSGNCVLPGLWVKPPITFLTISPAGPYLLIIPHTVCGNGLPVPGRDR